MLDRAYCGYDRIVHDPLVPNFHIITNIASAGLSCSKHNWNLQFYHIVILGTLHTLVAPFTNMD